MSYITNTAAVNFHSGANTGTAGGVTISHASLILRYGESNELLLWTGALVNSRVLSAGDPYDTACRRVRYKLSKWGCE